MESRVNFTPDGPQTLQSPFFGKLGNYFDRPEWWEEGAATLHAFFDESERSVNELDSRLEDLLDLLEPLKVAEESQRPTDPEQVGLSKDNHVAVAPAIENNTEDPLPSPGHRTFIKPLSATDVNTVDDAINKSSPGLTATTTTTTQTSALLRSSTRASFTTPDAGSSPEDGALEPSPFEVHKPRSSLSSAAVHHEDITAPVTTSEDDNVALKYPLAVIENDSVSVPLADVQDSISDGHTSTTEVSKPYSENDPTGLQAVKDEMSEDYGLATAIDSSIITQESDITVVHDPSSAAVSFFPPNPYSDEPYEFNIDTSENSSAVFDEQVSDNNHEDNAELSADSTLTSLASNTAQLPADYLEQLNDVQRWRFRTPSPPPSSPLSPPSPSWFATRHADRDTMAGADMGDGGDSTPSPIPPTPIEPTADFGKARTSRSRNTKGLRIITKVTDGVAESTETEDTKMPPASMTTRKVKRKQEQPHPDVPSQKRSLRSRKNGEEQSDPNARSTLSPEGESIKDELDRVQRDKKKAASRSTQRNSPDELAPASPDELANHPASNPFDLNKTTLASTKPKPNRSTATRSRVKKPVDTTGPLRKLVGVARATRAAVGNKELAGLLGASPPRKAEEKADADIGGRLRSQARTPTPAPVPIPGPKPILAPSPIVTPTTKSTDLVAAEATDTRNTDIPPPLKRKRLTGANPLGALELKELGSPPILETRTRARTSTVEPIPQPADVQPPAKSSPKRTRPDVRLSAPESAEVDELQSQDMEVSPTAAPPLDLTSAPEPISATQDTNTVAADISDINNTEVPSPTKRKRLTGANPLGALEIKELGSFPVLESRTRSRTATVESAPEPAAAQPTAIPAPRPTRSNPNITAPNTAELAETDPAVDSAPDPTPKPTPAKRVRKPAAKPVAKLNVLSPFALTAKSKGTPAASRKKAPAKQKAAEAVQSAGALTVKPTEATTKRKRGDGGEESEKEPTRFSKRIAGAEPEAE